MLDATDALEDNDDHFEYRHVILPKQMLKLIPKEYVGLSSAQWIQRAWSGMADTADTFRTMTRGS